MKHEWSESRAIYTNEEEGRARFLRYCLACGLLKLDAYSTRTRRSAVLFAMTGKGDTEVHVEEPTCVPVASRRTLRARSKRAPHRDYSAEFEQLEIFLLERAITFEQWQDISGEIGRAHV